MNLRTSYLFLRWHILRRILIICLSLSPVQYAWAQAELDLGSAKHLEETAGQSLIWVSTGAQYWSRKPPVFHQNISSQFGFGYAYEVDSARLAWHVLVTDDLQTGRRRFLSIDLISLERLLASGTIRPYYRFAFAVATDLVGAEDSFSQPEFYNKDNGTTGGFGLRIGSGFDLELGSQLFTRLDFGWALYGGVGRMSMPFSATFAFGSRL